MILNILMLYFVHSFVENTFPCENITVMDSCYDFGCIKIYSSDKDSCVKDPCFKIVDENTSCESGCEKVYNDFDIDCNTGERVNLTNSFCINQTYSHDANIDSCFYQSLKDGSCPGDGCRVYSLLGSDYCSRDSLDEDWCHDYRTDYCHLQPWCYINNGECVTDPCTDEEYPNPDHVCENPECTPKNLLYYSEDESYVTMTICVSKANTNPNVCYIYPYTNVKNGPYCTDTIYTPTICSDVRTCRVIDVDSLELGVEHLCEVVPSNESSNEDDRRKTAAQMSKSWMVIGIVFITLTAVFAVALVVVTVLLFRRKAYSQLEN